MKYQQFAILSMLSFDGRINLSSESLPLLFLYVLVFMHMYNNFHVLHDVLNAKPQFQTDPNRDPVLRDQQVFQEVTKQPLLLRAVFSVINS